MKTEPRNANPWGHSCHYGTKFACARCDFTEPMIVTNAPESQEQFASDVAEMIGYHALNIWPDLNGFSGHDTIEWNIVHESSVG